VMRADAAVNFTAGRGALKSKRIHRGSPLFLGQGECCELRLSVAAIASVAPRSFAAQRTESRVKAETSSVARERYWRPTQMKIGRLSHSLLNKIQETGRCRMAQATAPIPRLYRIRLQKFPLLFPLMGVKQTTSARSEHYRSWPRLGHRSLGISAAHIAARPTVSPWLLSRSYFPIRRATEG
jgi:hypothetical protein